MIFDCQQTHPGDNMPKGVTLSRGSDPFCRPRTWTGDKMVLIETEEIQFEEAQESKEDEVKESIIYFPPAQDDLETETARFEIYYLVIHQLMLRFCHLNIYAAAPNHHLLCRRIILTISTLKQSVDCLINWSTVHLYILDIKVYNCLTNMQQVVDNQLTVG